MREKLLFLTQPWLYLFAWIFWFCALLFLSSRPLAGPEIPPIIPIDKVLHWGYYGIGGALSTFYVLARYKVTVLPSHFIEILFFVGFVVGAVDEWHQSWYEFRSGNNLGDFIADCVGTYCGIKISSFMWRLFPKKINPS